MAAATNAERKQRPTEKVRQRSSLRTLVYVVLFNIFLLLFLVLGSEALLAVLYLRPPRIAPLLAASRKYYLEHDRYTISYMPSCAKYDPELTYVLRPGSCRFKNREFDTTVLVNSAGFRDDEISLTKPDILLLGDSLAMGWGVEQDETFGNIIEQRTGKRLLNTAVASYGTPRELFTLNRVDRSAAKILLIQYSDNDFRENSMYLGWNGKLHTMRPQDYQVWREISKKQWPHYTLGSYLKVFLPILWKELQTHRKEPAPTVEQQQQQAGAAAEQFLRVLSYNLDLLKDLKIVVFEINAYNRNEGYFAAALQYLLPRSPLNEQLDIEVVDLAPELDAGKHFYRIDDHLTPAGHQVVAEKLLKTLALHPEG